VNFTVHVRPNQCRAGSTEGMKTGRHPKVTARSAKQLVDSTNDYRT